MFVYKMYPTFREAFVYILYTKSKELCQLNFVKLQNVYKMFVYKMYVKAFAEANTENC